MGGGKGQQDTRGAEQGAPLGQATVELEAPVWRQPMIGVRKWSTQFLPWSHNVFSAPFAIFSLHNQSFQAEIRPTSQTTTSEVEVSQTHVISTLGGVSAIPGLTRPF